MEQSLERVESRNVTLKWSLNSFKANESIYSYSLLLLSIIVLN